MVGFFVVMLFPGTWVLPVGFSFQLGGPGNVFDGKTAAWTLSIEF